MGVAGLGVSGSGWLARQLPDHQLRDYSGESASIGRVGSREAEDPEKPAGA